MSPTSRTCRSAIGLMSLLAIVLTGAAPASGQTTVSPPGGARPTVPAAPRVAPIPRSEWTDADKALVAKYARYGEPDNAIGTLLRVPELFDGVMPYTLYLSEDSSLTPRQRELLILRAAWLTATPSLWARHAARAKQAGLTEADIRRIAEGTSSTPLETALLKMSDELFVNASVTDATWAALSASFDLFHLMDAVETFNHFLVLGQIFNTFGVQSESGASNRLPTDIPYRVVVPSREPPLKSPRAVAPPGRGIAVGRTFGLYPALSRAWSPRQTFILQKSPVTPRHREMFILRMGWNCRSEYEWSQHVGSVGRAREWGLEPRNIALGALGTGAPAWSAAEASILKAADELYTGAVVSDTTWTALVQAFGVPWAMSGIFSSADYRAISNSLNAYGVPHEVDDELFPVF